MVLIDIPTNVLLPPWAFSIRCRGTRRCDAASAVGGSDLEGNSGPLIPNSQSSPGRPMRAWPVQPGSHDELHVVTGQRLPVRLCCPCARNRQRCAACDQSSCYAQPQPESSASSVGSCTLLFYRDTTGPVPTRVYGDRGLSPRRQPGDPTAAARIFDVRCTANPPRRDGRHHCSTFRRAQAAVRNCPEKEARDATINHRCTFCQCAILQTASHMQHAQSGHFASCAGRLQGAALLLDRQRRRARPQQRRDQKGQRPMRWVALRGEGSGEAEVAAGPNPPPTAPKGIYPSANYSPSVFGSRHADRWGVGRTIAGRNAPLWAVHHTTAEPWCRL